MADVGSYVPVFTRLRDDPKFLRFVREMDIDIHTATGLLTFLWQWALTGADEDSRFNEEDWPFVVDAVLWKGDADKLLNALLASNEKNGCGFLERCGGGKIRFHNWSCYGGRLHSKRKASREYAQKKREEQGVSPRKPKDPPPEPMQKQKPTPPKPKPKPVGGLNLSKRATNVTIE